MLRIAVPNKGSLSEPAAEMLREAGYRTRRDPKELVVLDPTTASSCSTSGPATSPSTSARAPSTAVSPDVTSSSTPAAPAVEVMTLGFGAVDLPVCRPPGVRRRPSTGSPATGSRRATRASWRSTSPTPGIAAEVVRLDGAVETAITLGVADVIADVVETGATLRSQGLEVFGEPDPAQRGRPRPPGGQRGEGGHRGPPAPAARRHHGAALRPARLRHPGRSRRGRLRDHPGARVAHRLPAAEPGVVRGAGDGAPRA